MPRFVLLDHNHPEPHWDLMLEQEGVLWTWRLLDLLRDDEPITAERIGNHRLLYLDYEGPVSGDRGRVLRVDRGELLWHRIGNARFRSEIRGTIYHGTLEGECQSDGRWSLCYRSV